MLEGPAELLIDMNGLAQGTYVVRLTGDQGFSKVEKIAALGASTCDFKKSQYRHVIGVILGRFMARKPRTYVYHEETKTKASGCH